MSNSFGFTVDELNLVLEGLGALPFVRSAALITRLTNEFHAQNQQTTATAEAIQAAVDSGAAQIVAAPPNRKARRAAGRKGK